MSDWEQVGHVWVDAGCVAIGDPCYRNGGNDPDWEGYIKQTFPYTFDAENVRGDLSDEAVKAKSSAEMDVANVLGREGLGVIVSSGFGDGDYPVYVKRDPATGRIAEARIVFISDESENCDHCDHPRGDCTWYCDCYDLEDA